jgi:glycosyltransferase involved in cell wall biosynthesis
VVSRIYLGVDGPLPPALAEAVAAIEPKLFVVHRSMQNLGLARTLNALIARLQGEDLVFRMDADDVSLPLRYRAQLGHLLAHPDIDILGTAITELDEASGQTRVVRFAAGPAEALARMHWRVPVAHPTVCMRARVLALAGGYPVKGTNEDVAMWFLCASLGLRFDNLPEPLLVYRVAPDFWRRRGLRKARSELVCYLRGIFRLRGLFTLAYAVPVLRFGLRLMPTRVSRWAYNLPWRRGESMEPPTPG